MIKQITTVLSCITWSLITLGQAPSSGNDMVPIPGGSFTPLFTIDTNEVHVEPYMLDAYPVTNREFLAFVSENSKWKPAEVPPIFADEGYLRQFSQGLQPTDYDRLFLKRPVTNISWFAARAYCTSKGKRLPTLAEWEFAALASTESPKGFNDRESYQIALDWYARSSEKVSDTVGATFKNYYGAHDLHGLIWEWVNDFNSAMVFGNDQRNQKIDKDLFCAAGALGAADVKNYVAFMRYAFRSSLKANYTVGTLGFRCAQNVQP